MQVWIECVRTKCEWGRGTGIAVGGLGKRRCDLQVKLEVSCQISVGVGCGQNWNSRGVGGEVKTEEHLQSSVWKFAQ